MPNTTKHGHKPDMSGLKEGKAYEYCGSNEYVKQPGNAYGKGKSGLPPRKARTHSYTPDDSVTKR